MDLPARQPLSYAYAGALAGGRTTAGPSFACKRLEAKQVPPRNVLLRVLQSKAFSTVLAASSALELFADKLPGVGARTSPVPLALRTASGAVSGAALASADRRNPMLGALLGAAGAVAGTFATSYLRRALLDGLHLPNILAGLTEDALLYGLRRLA